MLISSKVAFKVLFICLFFRRLSFLGIRNQEENICYSFGTQYTFPKFQLDGEHLLTLPTTTTVECHNVKNHSVRLLTFSTLYD